MALPESEIRELAASLGLSGISPGQSKSQLVELITQQHHRAETRLEASNSMRQAMPARSLSQTSVTRAASLSAQRPGRRETERNERSRRNSQSLGAERSERGGSRSSHPTSSVISPSSRARMQPMQPQPPAQEARQSAPGRPPRGKAPTQMQRHQRPSGRAMTTSPRSNFASQSLLSPPTSGIATGHPPAAPRACSERRHRTQPSAEPRRPAAKSSASASSASPSRPLRPRLGVAGSALGGIGQMVLEERSTESRLRQA